MQNTREISRVELLPADLILQQIEAVVADIPPDAIKTGALGGHEAIEVIASLARTWTVPLIVDPVMISKHGNALLDVDGQTALAELLLPRSFLITPNLEEASVLTANTVETLPQMYEAARKIHDMGPQHVLVKGGHLSGPAVDLLLTGGEFHEFGSEHIDTVHTHGTGCTYSSAITAELAKGTSLVRAVAIAKSYVTEAIRTAPGLGGGSGPVNHHSAL